MVRDKAKPPDSSITGDPGHVLLHTEYFAVAPPCSCLLSRAQMATILTSLTKLVLSETPGLALNSVRDFPVLRVLDLCRCESLTPAALQPAAESCGQLEVLLLDGCHMLSSLKLTMPHLQVRQMGWVASRI